MKSVDAVGLTIGLINYMGEEDVFTFCNNEFEKGLFEPYRKGINEYGNGKLLDERVFRPKFYKMFGDNNAMFITLADDFAFVSRSLHSAHMANEGEPHRKNYNVQVVNGVYIRQDNKGKQLVDLADTTFLRKNACYPYVGAICLKINNGLLIGNGLELAMLIKDKMEQIAAKIEPCTNPLRKCQIIIINSFSNFELTVLIFSYEISKILTFVNSVRKLRLSDLDDEEKKKEIVEGSLLEMYKKEDNETDIDIEDAHLFSSTITRLGYDSTAWKDINDTENEDNSEKFRIQIDFELRTGHCNVFWKEIKDLAEDIWKNDLSNETDNLSFLTVPGHHTTRLEISSASIKEVDLLQSKILESQLIHSHVRKVRLKLIFPIDETKEERKISERHPSLMNNLRNACFEEESLSKLKSNLSALGVSRVLKERLLKMFSTFNTCLNDVTYFPFFLELRGFLKSILISIEKRAEDNCGKNDNTELHAWINKKIAVYERAYFNRFHHSSRALAVSDSNLEYNGGIQQVLTAYDYVYKTIMGFVTHDSTTERNEGEESIIYISGYEDVNSEKNSLKVDITHLTSPELLTTVMWKEALNFFWETLIATEGKEEQKTEKYMLLLKDILQEGDKLVFFRNSIRLDRRLDRRRRGHDILYNTISPKFMQYIVLENYVFYNGYNGDFELYTNRYWNYFLQMAHKYDSPINGEMNEKSFIIFMVRWLFVRKLAIYTDSDDASGILSYNVYVPYDRSIADLWMHYIADAISFVDILVDVLRNFSIIETLDADKSRFVIRGLNESYQDRPIKQQIEILKEIECNLESDSESLLQGKIKIYNSDMGCTFNYVNMLSLSLMKSAEMLNDISEDKRLQCKNFPVKVLRRDEKGKIVNSEGYQPLLADPLGGVFLHDNSLRHKYFRMRMAYQMSLWDLAFRDKKNDLKKIEKESKKKNAV